MSDLSDLHGVYPTALRWNAEQGFLGVSVFNPEIGERELREIPLPATFIMDLATRERGYGLIKTGVYKMLLAPVGAPPPPWPNDPEYKPAIGVWCWNPTTGEVRIETNAAIFRQAIDATWDEARRILNNLRDKGRTVEGLQPVVCFTDRVPVPVKAVNKTFQGPVITIKNWIERDRVPGWRERPPTVAAPSATLHRLRLQRNLRARSPSRPRASRRKSPGPRASLRRRNPLDLMAMNAAGIARRLGATRQGHNWRCACPRNCGYDLVLADGEGGWLLAHCYGGCSFAELLLTLVEFGLYDDDYASYDGPLRVLACPPRDDAKRIALARGIYDSGIHDARIQTYLRSREITQTSPILKFQEQARHRLGVHLPAMLAPVVDMNGEQIGAHMTFLRRDGTGQADLPKEFQRECRGVIRNGAIRLVPFDPDAELIIAEGVETGLAASEIFGLPAWSAVSADGLSKLVLPPDVRRIIIAADNDRSGAGQRNALAAYDRWISEGRTVRIVIPPDVGDDFNHVLIKRRSDARR